MQRFALVLGLMAVLFMLAAPAGRADDKPPPGGLTEVGTTKDACPLDITVKFSISGGEILERCKNDTKFN